LETLAVVGDGETEDAERPNDSDGMCACSLMRVDGIAVLCVDGDQDALHPLPPEVARGGSQHPRIEASPAMVRADHRIEEPDFTGIQTETDPEIILIVVWTVKPHIRQDLLAINQDAGTRPRAETTVEDFDCVPESLKMSDVVGPCPANGFVFGDWRWGRTWTYLENHHTGEAKEWCGDHGAHHERRRVADPDLIDLAGQASPPSWARAGASGGGGTGVPGGCHRMFWMF
jgi:hypothetical protein